MKEVNQITKDVIAFLNIWKIYTRVKVIGQRIVKIRAIYTSENKSRLK